jgi:hypothetical protein
VIDMKGISSRMIPGHGPVGDDRELREWRDSYVTSDHPIEEAYRAVTTGETGSR